MSLALLALAIGAFGIGTTEFVIMGLLPQVGADLGVSVPTAGFLVTGYALGVMIGAPIMTVLGTRISRKNMLMLLMGLFILGNVISAVAPVFAVMLIGRVVASLAHGTFFGIGAVVAAELVAPEKKAGAISMMFTGLTVANVVGVPLGTFMGQSAGWRMTFLIVAALGVLGLAGVAKLVPDMPKPEGVQLRHELTGFKNAQVVLAMAMTVLGFGGVFAAITYIAPMMTEVSGFAESSVTWLMVVFGLGMVAGNLVGGRFADRKLLISGETSTAKAYTALQLNAPTADLADLVKPDGPFHSLPTALNKPLLFIAGGMPIHRDGQLIGALGLGGGAPEQDHSFAQTALQAL
ncbi:MFS transporter [Saccharopolyspora rosea]|uniref:MFS transporter n=1 Tax=Saccharopolyspora rosea TaxID=524884 RepID=A0ABW3FZW3_9PSEU|nr:MFS transporter [Saccharopolyspora rosea]